MENPGRICIISMYLLVLQPRVAECQQSSIFNQTAFNTFLLSPAAMSSEGVIRANCHYKKSWLRLNDSPETYQLTIDGPVNGSIAMGVSLRNQKAGIFTQTEFLSAFQYKLKFSELRHLDFGVAGGFSRQLIDISRIKAESPEEFNEWLQPQISFAPKVNFGVRYRTGKYTFTSAVNDLVHSVQTYNGEKDGTLYYKALRNYLLSVSRLILISDQFKVEPYGIFRSIEGLPVQYEVAANLLWHQKLIAGIGYRKNKVWFAHGGFSVGSQIQIIYTYEYNQQPTSAYGNSHEIGLRFTAGTVKKETEDAPLRLVKELFEKLDEKEASVLAHQSRIDSLDKNISRIKSELELMRNKQVEFLEISKTIQAARAENQMSGIIGKGGATGNRLNYHIINPKIDEDYNAADSLKGNCKIVFGVYQLSTYAREFQRFLRREMNYETRLIQLRLNGKEFIYVCLAADYNALKLALIELKVKRAEIKRKKISITKGEAWILLKTKS
jgi:type IX secretion system PorP/SprF family membrane protein